MDGIEFKEAPTPKSARTSTVLVFLASFSIVMSWLACYAVTNALVAADLIAAWPREADPRFPRWMMHSFIGLFGAFAIVGLLFRWISNRQLRSIDAMND